MKVLRSASSARTLVTISVVAAASLCNASETQTMHVEPSNVKLFANGWTQQLLVSGHDGRQNATDLTSDSRFESSHPEVASVSASGVVRAGRSGHATIRVRFQTSTLRVPVLVAESRDQSHVRFLNDVVPLLTKLGCNSGGCHGKSTGQNGFKLSLFGNGPPEDYSALVNEARGRRIFRSDPDQSLMLQKAIGRVPHGGGRRLDRDSDDYRVLSEWIKRGAPGPSSDDPVLTRISVSPGRRVLHTNAKQQLLVTAYFSDGQSRDVSRQAVFESNVPEIAHANRNGLVTTRSHGGLFAVMVRFGGKFNVFHGTVPFNQTVDSDTTVAAEIPVRATQTPVVEARTQRTLDTRTFVKRVNVPTVADGGNSAALIDQHLSAQWRRLGIVPSAPADDYTFIRRVTIDICGTLPTPQEVAVYVADQSPDKRARLIDGLLERPEYASYFALKWAEILQNRGRGYSTKQQRSGTALFTAWIRDSIAANKPYDRFVSEILTATGSQAENPPAVWYRSVRTSQDYVESIAQAFLGVRIQCAQCHHHPAERWSQADYFGLAAVFSRVGRKRGFADAEVPTNEMIYLKHSGDVVHPLTGEVMRPRPLGGPDFELTRYDDPRRRFAEWITARDNLFFASTMVNRMWGHFLGRGIIHPIDDARFSNPASNPELLDELARGFVESGFDIKQLIRRISASTAYQLSSIPNQTNHNDIQSFARFYARRLTAEVLLDGISQVLEVSTNFPGGPGAFPAGTRAIDLPDENVAANFLDVFGRPARTSACECERSDAPALAQALELVNSTEIQRKLVAEDGYVERLSKDERSTGELVRAIFLRVFARPSRSEEVSIAAEFLESESDRTEAYRSLLWSLLATNEFLFNH